MHKTRALLILLVVGFLLLIACDNTGSSAIESTPAQSTTLSTSEETTTILMTTLAAPTLPAGATGVKWKDAYINKIKEIYDAEVQLNWPDKFIAQVTFDLCYVSNDNVPELLIAYTMEAAGTQICTVNAKGEVVIEQLARLGGFTYIKRSNLFRNQNGLSGHYPDCVYVIKDSAFKVIAQGVQTLPNLPEDGEMQYEWQGQSVSEREYNKRLNAVYNTNKAVSPEIDLSAQEVIQKIIALDA
ncbi:MAG: hypothetical protein LBN05_01455 [Oscillospiraceae bacterium]|jgi:hypothetical protein|nr:hypothetical protein [Oscillospiraceae bacterium]